MDSFEFQKSIQMLISKDLHYDAINLLEGLKNPNEIQIKQLSLLYRFYGQLENELALFKSNFTKKLQDSYLIMRNIELQKGFNELLSQRKTLNNSIGDEQKSLLVNELKSRMCFVVPSNDEYFSLLLECVHSLLACSDFAECPIYIVNCGLSHSNTIRLNEMGKRISVINIHKFLLKYRIELPSSQFYLSALVFRGFLDDIFENYDFCFYIDSDAWIQDQSAIYEYLYLASEQGIAIPKHPFNTHISAETHWIKRETLTSVQKKQVIGFPAIINCCFCVNLRSDQYAAYKKTMLYNISKLGVKWGIDQETLLFIAAKCKLKLLPTEYAYEGAINLKIEDDGSHILFSNQYKLIKIFHLGGGIKQKSRKWKYFVVADYKYHDKLIKLNTSSHFMGSEWNNREKLIALLKHTVNQ